MPEFFRDRFARPLLRPLAPAVAAAARASAGIADELITVHEPLRQLAIARGVDPDRISVVMNSADGDLFDPARHPRRPFMEDGELRLIHHSNLQRIYGAAIAGRGGRQPRRLASGQARRLRGRAVSGGARGDRRADRHERPRPPQRPGADRRRCRASIAAADIGVVPSLPERYMQYSLSTKLLEYAAMGIPIVASDLATFRAHFTDEAIRYVPGGDPGALAAALRELAADPVGTARIGAEAHRQAERYEWREQARRYLEIVERLAGAVGLCVRRGVAQPGSAPALGAGGRPFESGRPDHSVIEESTRSR